MENGGECFQKMLFLVSTIKYLYSSILHILLFSWILFFLLFWTHMFRKCCFGCLYHEIFIYMSILHIFNYFHGILFFFFSLYFLITKHMCSTLCSRQRSYY
jgi:hypothetical protein